MVEVNKLVARIIVGAPHDDPQPFMGPVIDNDTADMLTESFPGAVDHGRATDQISRTADRGTSVPVPCP